jgi:hypothetical protein
MSPSVAPTDAGLTHDDFTALMVKFRNLNPVLRTDASLLQRIRQLETDNTLKGREITKLQSQFKDSEERNRELRQLNYDMSRAAAKQKGHLIGQSEAQVSAPAVCSSSTRTWKGKRGQVYVDLR